MQELNRILGFIGKKKRGKISLLILFSLFLLSILSPFIANNIPIVCKSSSGVHFPIVNKIFNKAYNHTQVCDWSLHPIIPYSQKSLDVKNGRFKSPFGTQDVSTLRHRHWLGTDALGRDTFAGLLHGSSIALRIGFFAAFLSFIIGIFMGSVAGYFGNEKLKLNFLQICLVLITLILLLYQCIYGFFFGYENDLLRESIVFVSILSFGILGLKILNKQVWKKISLPIDNMLLWILEIYKSIPNIFFILILLSVVIKTGITSLVLIIGFVIWPIVARYTRAEVLKLKEENFIKSAETSGISTWNIIIKHLLLNAIGPALVSFAFSFSSAILLEASLSFLGLGLPVEEVSWGSMLAEVRNNYKAWWLALFPGVAIFLVVSALNYLGEMVGDYFSQN